MDIDKSLYGMNVREDDLLIKTQWPDNLLPAPKKGIPTLGAIKELFVRSLPLAITYFSIFSIKNAAMHFLRNEPDVTMISAVGIGFTIINIFAVSVYLSLNVGLMTKSADAYTAETYQNVGFLLHKGFLINTFVSIPSLIIFCLAEQFCLMIGFDSQTAHNVGNLVYICIPGTFCLMIFTTLTSYVNACNKFSAPQLIQILSAVIFWITAYVFAELLDWGIEGIGLCYNIMYILAVIGIIVYIKVKNPAPGTFFWPRRDSFNGITKLLAHQLYTGWTVYIECIVFEIIFLFCAGLDTIEIIGFTIAYNNLPIIYILPTAFSDTMLTHIVSAIQERDISKAQKFLRVGFGLNMIAMGIALGLYLGLIDHIAALYVTEPNTQVMAAKMLRLYSIIIIPDFIHIGLQSALKAIGKERTATLIRNLCYYIVALPLAFCLCYTAHLKTLGLILGPMISVTIMTIISIVIFWRTKWADVIKIVVGDRLFDDGKSATEVDEREVYSRSLSMAL